MKQKKIKCNAKIMEFSKNRANPKADDVKANKICNRISNNVINDNK
jgi:hypothetical protein